VTGEEFRQFWHAKPFRRFVVRLADGRTISAPLAWFPRLRRATPAERRRWRPIARGEGIHWPDLDEDISVEDILSGHPSGERQRSLKRLLDELTGKRGN